MSASDFRNAYRARKGGSATRIGAHAPPPAHLVGVINKISGGWFGRPAQQAHLAGDDGVPTPEELASVADECNVDVAYAERTLESLGADDFPCVILLNSGLSRLLTGRPEPGIFEVDADNGRVPMSIEALKAEFSGTVFFVKPDPSSDLSSGADAGGQAASGESAAPAVKLRGVDIFKLVFRQTVSKQRGRLIQLLVAAMISNVLMLALPMFTMAVYDRVIPHLAMETLWALSSGVILALMVDLALRFVRLKYVDAIALNASLALQATFYRRLLQIRYAFAPRSAGGMAGNMREIEAICQTVPMLAVSVLVDLPFFVLLLVLLYTIGGMVLLAPVAGVVLLGGLHLMAHSGAKRAVVDISDYARKQSNMMIETVDALETVKATASEKRLLRRWERLGDDAAYAGHLGRLWHGMAANGAMIVTQGVIVLTLIIGVYQISAGAMSVGALAASTLLVGRSIGPISQLITHAIRAVQLASTAESISLMLSAPLEKAGDSGRSRVPIKGQVQLYAVGFAYPGAPAPSLADVSLTIEPGERVGVIGRIGSGKSTLLRLLTRMQEPQSGGLMVDGHDIRQYAPQALRQAFGFMQQESVLFDATLRENIVQTTADVTDEAFEEAVRISGVREIAARHPGGYSLQVGMRGERLSGGERQMVALARVLAARPRALLLDEPTASMDNSLEARLLNDLKPYLEGRTLIVATHRAPLLALVDRIIWMEGGKIIADGPKAEVMARLNQKAS